MQWRLDTELGSVGQFIMNNQSNTNDVMNVKSEKPARCGSYEGHTRAHKMKETYRPAVRYPEIPEIIARNIILLRGTSSSYLSSVLSKRYVV